jgi:hypothetical protein
MASRLKLEKELEESGIKVLPPSIVYSTRWTYDLSSSGGSKLMT